MSSKSSSIISIKQVFGVSLILMMCLSCGIESKRNGKYVSNENINEEQDYEAAIVENTEEDYIHYEEKIYLEKKEITNVVSRGSNVDRKNKEEIIENKEQDIVVLEENKEEVIENNNNNNEYVINNKEENNEQVEEKILATEPPTEYKKVLEAKATAYCLCKKCCGKSESHPEYGLTASGLKIIPGTNMKVIAVDPKVIPLGSKVYVEGLNGAADYGYAVAADTGGAINSLKVDLYMETHEKAYQWGRKSVKVYIVE